MRCVQPLQCNIYARRQTRVETQARDSAEESEREGMMYPCGRQQCVERDGASVNWRRRNALFNTVYLQSTLSVVVMVVTSF